MLVYSFQIQNHNQRFPLVCKAISELCKPEVAQFDLDENGKIVKWYRQDLKQPTQEEIDAKVRELKFIEAKAKKLDEINQAFESAMEAITAQYPEIEKLSWDKQEREARAYLADNTVATPLLDSIATARGVDKTELAQKIVKKADTYSLIAGSAIGKRQALEDKINSATSIDELEAIVW